MDIMKEDWNNSELSASTSVSEDNLHNNSEIPNLYSPKYAFENNVTEETVFFKSVPTDEELYGNTATKDRCEGDTVTKASKKTSEENNPSKKRKRKQKSVKHQSDEASLQVEMESLSISQTEGIIEINKNNTSHIDINRTITRGQEGNTQSPNSQMNLSWNIPIKTAVSCDVNITSTQSSHKDEKLPEDNEIIDINVNSECHLVSSETVSGNIDTSMTEAERSLGNLEKPLDSNVEKKVQFNLTTESEGQEAAKPKRKGRMPAKTKAKATQVNIKEKTQKSQSEENQVKPKDKKVVKNLPLNTDPNPPSEVKQTKPKEKKVLNNRAKRNRNPSKQEDNTDKALLNENSVVPDKIPKDKVVPDIPSLSCSQLTLTENVELNDSKNYQKKELQLSSNSTSYNINIIKEADDSNKPISISLPPQSYSKVTNINVIVNKKDSEIKKGDDLIKHIKKEKISPIKASIMSGSPKIKTEKRSDDDYSSKKTSSLKSTEPQKKKETQRKTNQNPDYTKRKETLAKRKETLARKDSSSEDDSSTGKDTSNEDDSSTGEDSSSNCSCSHCESSGSDECSCSDCALSSTDSCSCSDCCESQSSNDSSYCECEWRSRHRYR